MAEQVEVPLIEKRSKVKSSVFKKEWSGNKGPMYDHIIEFENGDRGVYQVNLRDQEIFKVGVEMDYGYEIKKKGRYFDTWITVPKKRDADGNFKKGYDKNYRADHISYAARYVTDLMVAGKLPDNMKFRDTFNMIYKVMDDKLNEINTQTPTTETEKK